MKFVNRQICCRVEPTALPPHSGKVLLARIETITLSCVVFRGANRRPLGREEPRLIFPEVIVIQTQHKEAYYLLTTPSTPILSFLSAIPLSSMIARHRPTASESDSIPNKSFLGSDIFAQTKETQDNFMHISLFRKGYLCLVIGLQTQTMLVHYLLTLLVITSMSAPDWTKVNDLFHCAIQNRIFPGGSITVANQTHIIYRKNFGYLSYTYQLHDVQVKNQTKYDIASVTKVMATTFGVMSLIGSNLMKLTDPVTKYIPNYDTNKKGNTTIANLLLHNSGLKYDYPGPLPRVPDEVWEYITYAKPDFPVGTEFQYSNLGFLLLSKIVANVSRKTFENYFVQNSIFAGLKNTNFNPPQSEWYKIAPTQYDTEIRKRIVRGEVHERLAYFFGGVAGHSGLFTDADDLTRYMRILLNKGKLPGQYTRILSESVIEQFTTRVEGLPYHNTMGYGFGTGCPSSKMSNCFGHDGSTGVMAWADKDKKIIFVIMNNRGHPDVNNGKINAWKPKIADAIMEALGY